MSKDNINSEVLSGDINKMIHEPARLKLMAQLYVVDSVDFLFLMKQTGLTQGNLSGHLTKLEKVKYIEIEKGYNGKRPQTVIKLSDKGRKEFDDYLKVIRSITDAFL